MYFPKKLNGEKPFSFFVLFVCKSPYTLDKR